MKMHPYFTEIPLRSFDAMAFEGHLSEVLLALIVDPLEAEDVSRAIREIYPTRIELAINGKVADAPIALADFLNLPSKHAFEQMKITLAQWAMTTNGANDALRVLAEWDRRFGVWCACQVARDALCFVPEGELRPLRAIETTEAWVVGRATDRDVLRAVDAADAAVALVGAALAETISTRNGAYGDIWVAANAAYAATYAAWVAVNAASLASRIVAYADVTVAANVAGVANWVADVTADGDPASDATSDAELVRLLEVVANACLTFPG